MWVPRGDSTTLPVACRCSIVRSRLMTFQLSHDIGLVGAPLSLSHPYLNPILSYPILSYPIETEARLGLWTEPASRRTHKWRPSPAKGR